MEKVGEKPKEGFYRRRGKRILDIIGAVIGLIISAPLLIIIWMLVKLTSPGPAIYKQVRVGKDGEFFTLYKFRSMKREAELYSGPQETTRNDTRITPVGRILRRTGLDELPQFFNVLKGDMSVVGPRPERPYFISQNECYQGKWLSVKPGLFGLCEVKYGFSDDCPDITPEQKVPLDLEYIDKYSFWLDIKIITIIAWKILFREYYFSKILKSENGDKPIE
jgi:lipopolysaccharide/colanic/teichoic acid biosynthesis glycosyltransferase